MLEIVRELVDAVHSLKGISGNRRAELHAELDKLADDTEDTTEDTEAEAPRRPGFNGPKAGAETGAVPDVAAGA
jgi:hypothetical protein